MIEEILRYILGAALGAIIAIITALWRQQKAIKPGLRALLRDRIIQSYNHRMEKGFCPIYALTSMDDMYKQYKALGGNGAIDEIMEKLHELPTQNKEE